MTKSYLDGRRTATLSLSVRSVFCVAGHVWQVQKCLPWQRVPRQRKQYLWIQRWSGTLYKHSPVLYCTHRPQMWLRYKQYPWNLFLLALFSPTSNHCVMQYCTVRIFRSRTHHPLFSLSDHVMSWCHDHGQASFFLPHESLRHPTSNNCNRATWITAQYLIAKWIKFFLWEAVDLLYKTKWERGRVAK
jgi:hypothetical protein